MFGIENKVVVVTGGCGGIGGGLAEILAKLGAKVAIIARNQAKVDAKAAAIREASGNPDVFGAAADIVNEDSVRKAMAAICDRFGSIYGLVNCAGTTHVEYLSTMSIDDWQAVMDANLRGTVICAKVAGEYMRKNHLGRVINFSSLASTHGKPQYTAYTPSKAAVDGFTFTLAAEWARLGITVNAVAPAFVLSDMTRRQWAGKEDQLAGMDERNPQKRSCSPELLSGVVVFLLSESASYVNGQVIGCDGGLTRGDISMFKPEEDNN